jgi:hypothetical protein
MYVTLSFKFYTLSNRNLLIHLISISIYIISICLFKEFITHLYEISLSIWWTDELDSSFLNMDSGSTSGGNYGGGYSNPGGGNNPEGGYPNTGGGHYPGGGGWPNDGKDLPNSSQGVIFHLINQVAIYDPSGDVAPMDNSDLVKLITHRSREYMARSGVVKTLVTSIFGGDNITNNAAKSLLYQFIEQHNTLN